MKRLASIAPIILSGLTPLALAAQTKAEQKPNVIFILADDMGYECVGAYGGTYNTPNIDRMAQQGVMFNYAYSQPLSTPSRVQVMTGKYNYKNYADFGVLNQDQKTFGNLAQSAGYKTAIVGKWQLGANSALPAHFGFDNYCLWQLNYKRSGRAERYAYPLVEADGEVVERTADTYGPDVFIEYIENFISENRDEPFFLYYPMVLVHEPFVSTPDSEDWDTNKRGRFASDTVYFKDMVQYCDKNVGRIIAKLKAEGIYENTLVIFTGDNGTNKKIESLMQDGSTINGGKGTTLDAGTHVAMVATYGSRQGKPTQCGDLIDFTDIMPTVADAVGVEVPKAWDTDGVSFLPQIEGKGGTPRKWTFCHYDSFFGGSDKPNSNARRYIRDHRFKLYSTGEFYDITNDVLEEHDIKAGEGGKSAEKVRKNLAKELAKFPAWKVGDIPVKKIIFPELEVDQKIWTEEDS